MRAFYTMLGAVALVGGAVLFWMSRSGGPQFIEKPVPLNTATFAGFVMGSDSAAVEIVEYADFQCGACGHFAVLSGPDVKQRLVASGLVRWRFRGFPLPGHDRSLLAHHAAACAGEQNRFWEMHDQLFFNQRTWVESTRPQREIRNLAVAAGVDANAYEQCMNEERYLARIQATKNEIAALGISSTPTFDIGRMRVSGSIPFDSVKALVDLAVSAQGQ